MSLHRRRRAVRQQEGVRSHAGATCAHVWQHHRMEAGGPPCSVGTPRGCASEPLRWAERRRLTNSAQGGQQQGCCCTPARRPCRMVNLQFCVTDCRSRAGRHRAGMGYALRLGGGLHASPVGGPCAISESWQCSYNLLCQCRTSIAFHLASCLGLLWSSSQLGHSQGCCCCCPFSRLCFGSSS